MVFIKPTIIRDGVTADGITQRKYNYIRAEQLFRAEKGLRLLDDASVLCCRNLAMTAAIHLKFKPLLSRWKPSNDRNGDLSS